MYKEELLDKPAMLVINKMDTEGAKEKYLEIKNQLENLDGRLLQGCIWVYIESTYNNINNKMCMKKILIFFRIRHNMILR